MQLPFVSVVIVTRNRPEMVRQCLVGLRQQTYSPFEIIIVDGSSTSQTEQVARQHPEARYIFLPDGKDKMTQARNLGVEAARGVIIAFLDDDSIAREGWLTHLVNSYDSPFVGGVGGRVVDRMEMEHQTDQDVVGKVFSDGQTIDNFARELNDPIEVDRFKGCNMSFRKPVLHEVGLFDNYYGTNWDDVDICLRVKKAGYRLVYNSDAVVDHLLAPQEDSRVRSGEVARVVFIYYRNRTYLVLTHFGGWGRHLLSLFYYDTVHHLYLLRKEPSRRRLAGLLANLGGKIVGVTGALRKRLSKF